jgi:cell fate regulator YaaT (PSP1 superfamily)
MVRSVIILFEDGSLVNAVSPPDLAIHEGDWCVVDCNRIPEFGKIVKLTDRDAAPPRKGSFPLLLRRATLQDQARAKENAVTGRMASKTVHKRAEEQRLPIHLVQNRYSFDRSVLHITFTSEERVEVAEFAKGLARELGVRVEMKSLGIRDAAKLVGGMAQCGRPLCCKTWMREFASVTVRMAKAQKLALNPGAISGMCGRLKCCLKYEFDNYREVGDNHAPGGVPVRDLNGCACECRREQEKRP